MIKTKHRLPLKAFCLMALFILMPFTGLLATGDGQDVRISLDRQNVPLGKILEEIESLSGYTVLVRTGNFDLDERASIKVQDSTLDEVFTALFAGKDIRYTISDRRVSIFRPTEPAPPQKREADRRTVSGIVTDSGGTPISGAVVSVPGGSPGTTTGAGGRFSLDIPENTQHLQVSFLGYEARDISVAGRSFVEVSLEEDLVRMDEVMVVGYATQKKSVVTAAISSVKGDELSRMAPTRIDNIMKGMVSGISITQDSGQPGSGSRVLIRGVGTINNSNPLYIVDGMATGGNIAFLNPADVESVEILKDAASAAIYGARGANGVILVTTKQGAKGRGRVDYNFSYGWQNPWRQRNVLDAAEYATLMNEMLINDGEAPRYTNPASYGKGTDWQKEVFNSNAPVIEHQVGVSGGNDRGSYYLSFGYFYHEGIVGGNFDRSDYTRYTARFNNNYTVFDLSKERDFINVLKVGTNISYSNIKSSGVGTNSERGTPLSNAMLIAPVLPVYSENPEEVLALHPNAVTDQNGRVYNIVGDDFGSIVNPLATLSLPGDVEIADKFVGSIWAELQLYKNLKLKSSYSTDIAFWQSDGYSMPYYLGPLTFSDISSVYSDKNRYIIWQIENVLSYNFGVGGHDFTILLGQSSKSERGSNVGGQSRDIRDPSQPYINTTDLDENSRNAWGQTDPYHRLASYFGRVSYNYKERYMVEFTFRRDGSSNFGSNNKWANFPSVSAGWNITNESFMEGRPRFLTSLKLRASWGMNGNQSIGAFRYTSLVGGGYNYILGLPGSETMAPGVLPTSYENRSLKWEESVQTDIGLDAQLFGGRVTLGFDWYNKRTNGMLMTMPLPYYIGNNRPVGNVGDMKNSGVEFDINYRFRAGDAQFSIGGNASYNKNTLIKLGSESGWANYDVIHGNIGTITRAQNGLPFPFFYGMKTGGIFQNEEQVAAYVNKEGELLQPNAKPGDMIYLDTNGNGTIDDDDRTMIGKGMPDWTFGFNLSVNWRGLDFSALFHAVAGCDIYDASSRTDYPFMNLPAYMKGRWHGEGTSDKYPRLTRDLVSANSNNNWQSSDFYVHDGSFLRLRNIQLGYTFPKNWTKKIFVENLRVYVSAENLFTLTSYHGYDPEIASGGTSLGVDRGVYPQPRVFSIGANVTF